MGNLLVMLTIILSVCLSVFATAVMAYISMAIPIGPWIETTLVLTSMIFVFAISFVMRKALSAYDKTRILGLSSFSGGIGGILATGFGFSMPVLYFIAPDIFNSWMERPFYFSAVLSGLAFMSGGLGLLVADIFQHRFIEKQELSFPIGSMVYKMINAQDKLYNALQLCIGFISTQLFLLYLWIWKNGLRAVQLFNSFNVGIFKIPRIIFQVDLVPMLLAIGFITGHLVAVPLGAGLLSKLGVIIPLHALLKDYLEISYFNTSYTDFTVAFSTGIVLFSAGKGLLLGMPKFFKRVYSSLLKSSFSFFEKKKLGGLQGYNDSDYGESLVNKVKKIFCGKSSNLALFVQLGIVLGSSFIVLSYFEFSLLSQIYLLLFTFVCCYQLSEIAGKIGLAPLGRFATFVLIPGLFIFGYNSVQVMIVSLFVEVAGGVACDALFGRKFGKMADVEEAVVRRYQWLGLVVSSLSIGIVSWFLIKQFGLCSLELPMQKALSRALLVNALNVRAFKFYSVVLGAIFGYSVTLLKINPVLMLGGILMPESISIMLIVGGLLGRFSQDRERWTPLWSGVFAANSLWMIAKSLLSNINLLW